MSTSELIGSFSGRDPTSGIDLEHLSAETLEEVREMLTLFSDMRNGKLGEVKCTERRIALAEGAKPFRSQPYRVRPRARQVKQKSVDNMLISRIIVSSQSEWASPVFFGSRVRRKSEVLRGLSQTKSNGCSQYLSYL